MENVVLAIHLILALLLTGAVLMQRSEGGGLGMGGSGNVMTARGAANAMTKATWILAAAFITTSIILTILAAADSAGSSVTDQIGVDAPAPAPVETSPLGGDLLPPSTDAPAAPPAADAPAAPPANP
jgi:preprotein translocase subunit SecG